MFQTKVVEKIKTQKLCSLTFSENRAVYEIIWEKKYCTAREVTNVKMAHCMLDT